MTRPLKALSNSEGYTFIEVFLTLIIVAAIGLIVTINSHTIKESITKGKKRLNYKYQLLTMRILLKNEASKVVNPWFSKDYIIEKDSESLTLYYYNGDPEETLRLSNNNNGILIETGKKVIFKSNLLKGKFELERGYIIYLDNDIEFIFPLGAFLA